jgi:hypothetical protein
MAQTRGCREGDREWRSEGSEQEVIEEALREHGEGRA